MSEKEKMSAAGQIKMYDDSEKSEKPPIIEQPDKPKRRSVILSTDLNFRRGRYQDRLIYALRECHANAKTYGATDIAFIILHYNGDDYLAYAHNGRSFENIYDILTLGCTPNLTGGEGNSHQGCGLVQSAVALHRSARLIVATRIGDEIIAGCGEIIPNTRRWGPSEEGPTDVSEEWREIIKQRFGPRTLKEHQFNVFYLFKIDLDKNVDRNFISMDMVNTLSAMAPTMPAENANIHFCSKEIGYPYPTNVEGKEHFKERYRSLDTALFTGKGNAGSVWRRAVNMDAYNERYRIDDGHFKLKCKVFVGPITTDLKGLISSASIEIDGYSGEMHLKEDGNESQWMACLRDGKKQGGFRKGTGNEQGRPPTITSFLLTPWVATEMYKIHKGTKDENLFSRFYDNAMLTYQKTGTLMDIMGLNYSDGKKGPFVVVRVKINDINGVLDKHNKLDIEYSPITFLSDMQRRPDFTFENVAGGHALMKLTCENIVKTDQDVDNEMRRYGEMRKNDALIDEQFENLEIELRRSVKDYARLKDFCAKYFPIQEFDCIQIYLDESEVAKGRVNISREKNVEIYDVSKPTEDGVKLFDGVVHAGQTRLIAIRDTKKDRWIDASELKQIPATRGIKLLSMAKDVAEAMDVNVEKSLEILSEVIKTK